MTREAAIARLLAGAGFGAAQRVPLARDASFRHYDRVLGGPHPAVLMDAPPPQEDVRPFVRVARHMAGLGLSVPDILAVDEANGLLLIEDLGDATYPACLAAGLDETLLTGAAIDALAVLHASPPPATLPAWDAAAMTRTAAATFLDWWWPAAFGAPAATAIRDAFGAAMAEMLAPLAALPAGFVHRDYFAANLMWLPDREGARRAGILDFQDAARGPGAYDLVALIEDARRDIAPALRQEMTARYLARRPDLDPEAFRAAMAICAAQRHLRVASLWVRLDRRDGKPHYLVHGPRTWGLLATALRHPATRPLARFLDAHVPESRRGNPQAHAA